MGSLSKFEQLRLYLKALPASLEEVSPTDVDANVNRLLNFVLDDEWVQDVGEEGAVNRAIEAALHKFLPRNDAGIFFISQRGKGVEALADVLEIWLTKIPNSMLLQNWLRSSIESSKKCIQSHGGSLPELPKARSTTAKEANRQSETQLTLDGLVAPSKTQVNPQKSRIHKKPDTKVLPNIDDPNYVDTDESDDERK
ncbi:hypothetical protein H0H93_013281, partial [Arthromyces matolae]